MCIFVSAKRVVALHIYKATIDLERVSRNHPQTGWSGPSCVTHVFLFVCDEAEVKLFPHHSGTHKHLNVQTT